MIAKETRIFVFEGKEYRIHAGESVRDLPKKVTDAMVSVGLVEKPKTAKPNGRRKK